ncbi:SusD/RagB family nutrient-binding outer membrane lipoprotein [Chitinophaga flava]|uniref:SusD/RagB family nutrient-binding outer membrane lipoprotein n=1 Tax=Chitinophaga flava TaxID=2259036 RepID=A0A365XZJ8_9BACT|nr:SusD/RagB family nutrient-binding outer membrane lipoprotein [Chitinophaga flava]RBL91772.1 SusD/RagB family nutrient-binding outer membrane lipoprotein [Chitinophaga flava]
MKAIYTTLFAAAAYLAVTPACSKFDAINTNPNATSSVTPSLLATNLILDITGSSASKSFVTPYMVSKHIAWGELAQSEQYNSFGRTSLGGMQVLTNVQKMISQAAPADKNAYTGLGLFIKAYKLYYLSMSLGDIPYSDALNGETGNVRPKYDEQKKVMQQVLADLENADKLLSAAGNFSGDPTQLGGSADLWRRVINSFRLKVLISLSKKVTDPDLRIKEQFAQIATTSPLLRSNADNLQTVYSNKAGQIYPYNNTLFKGTAYGMISSVIIDTLKKLNDYRLFYYAAPSAYAIKTEGKKADDWNAYPGTDPTPEFSTIAKIYTAGKHCAYNLRYTDNAPGEPVIRIGYAEQNFILAEAAVLGWTSGSAKTFYEEGVKAAMNFVATNTPDDIRYHSGRKITADYINNTYLTGTDVGFATTADMQLKQIYVQKYILYFMQHPWDAYYECRRTGYPVLPVNPATSLNQDDKTQMPVRWMYPQDEYDYNQVNLKEALQRQYGGADKTNNIMWILK